MSWHSCGSPYQTQLRPCSRITTSATSANAEQGDGDELRPATLRASSDGLYGAQSLILIRSVKRAHMATVPPLRWCLSGSIRLPSPSLLLGLHQLSEGASWSIPLEIDAGFQGGALLASIGISPNKPDAANRAERQQFEIYDSSPYVYVFAPGR